ncbi:MAG: hypothetical protein JST04_01795 [Bdellovibrionales bacterium]|nr:hypothetical protein [Bdellovibrionales bacterium]
MIRFFSSRAPCALSLVLLSSAVPSARAAGITLDPSQFTAPLQLLTDQAANSAAQAIGLGGEFRPITGVDPPTGPIGLEVGLAAQIVKLPDEFRDILKQAGFDSDIPGAIPSARIQANLRLGERFAVEAGYLKYQGYKLTGIALKLKVVEPEEGFGAAIRLAYADNDLGIVSTRTWTPAILTGAKLAFAEPYMGLGYSIAASRIDIPIDIGGGNTVNVTARGKRNGLSLFGGLLFDLAAIQIAFEGNYSNAGVPGLAARAGVRF